MAESDLIIRPALRSDVPAVVALLADDILGRMREAAGETGLEPYYAAFDEIERDARNALKVAERDGEVVGTYQVTYIPYLSRGGNERALIEAVRVSSRLRGQGIGKRMMQFAIDEARARGCRIVQLTSDKQRQDAHRFYRALGFAASHVGMKLVLQG